MELPKVKDGVWPSNVQFTSQNIWDKDIPKELREKYKPARRKPKPNKNVRICKITDEKHPAFGEYGLFAQSQLAAHSLVIYYVGTVSLDANASKTSNYVLQLDHELAIDSEKYGNEARFVNDYRNTGKPQNVCFANHTCPSTKETLVGIFVMDKPIKKGEELLISYGRSFWKTRLPPQVSEEEKYWEEYVRQNFENVALEESESTSKE